jgi:hypothetical protein
MYSAKTRIGSPRIIPRVKLSPKVCRKNDAIVCTNKNTPYNINREYLLKNPTINPETQRTIKLNGKTYQKLAKKYNI